MIYEGQDEEKKQVVPEDTVGKKILDSAVEIINQGGYEELTIRKVAKESGCSNSAIYQRFEDKNALGRAVAALQAEPFLSVMDENYLKEQNLLTNYNRITRKMLEKFYSLGAGDVYMQVLYQGGMKLEENPFLLRIETYLNTAMAHGEIKVTNARETAFLVSASFLGFVQMVRASQYYSMETAQRLLEKQNQMLFNGIRILEGEEPFWDMLKERGVNVEKALERMKGNRDTYREFLTEFFGDPDFKELSMAIDQKDVKGAFAYAHGLKGMAANLGLDTVHNKLSVLVEILRLGRFDGAKEAYEEVMEACAMITMLL